MKRHHPPLPRPLATPLDSDRPRLNGPRLPHRLAGLDGLRALAVSSVLLYHFFPDTLPGGFIGVDVFFVISGFLITWLLLAERNRTGSISLAGFWQRRLRRLVPPLIPLILVGACAALIVGGDVLVGLGRQLLGAFTFSYNWVSISQSASYFSADQPELFRNLWSLAVEEQFYLVWPLLIAVLFLIRRPTLRVALVVLLAAVSATWMGILFTPGSDATRVYFGSDTHSFGLALGAALALLLRGPLAATGAPSRISRIRPLLGLAALAGLVALAITLTSDGSFTYRGGLVLVSVLTTTAIWAGVSGDRFGRLLDVQPLRAIGIRSYGIYLWHWPVLVLLQAAWPVSSVAAIEQAIPIGLLALVITLAAAEASYRWVEQPIRRLGFRGGIRKAISLVRGSRVQRQVVVACCVTAVLLCAGTVAALVSAPQVASSEAVIERGQQALDEAAAAAAQADAAGAAAAAPGTDPAAPNAATPPPEPTPPSPGERMSAVGDSVMLASAPELQEEFPGIAIDAAVSRGMGAAPEILAALAEAGQLRPVVVLGLGTNGPIEDKDLERVRTIIGPDRQLIVVNAFAERNWTPGVNQTLAEFAARSSLIELADWSTAIAPHTDVLADDNIHPGPTGGHIYADCVSSALQRLTELPPAQQPGPNRLIRGLK
ncbi:acyltransferase family protein [Leifsonia sp. A12D58]|uniref:acyltransferase family protein n=1 Tax=Leifsonia sp. A12D58 TaxID=3397674 RepID=UPI0039E1E36A